MLPPHIVIQPSTSALFKDFLSSKNYTRVALLMDEHSLACCYPLIEAQLPQHRTIVVPSGEKYKNLDTCVLIWQQLTEHAFDRHALLIILGGGVLGDLGGFCAATYKRGIDFILLPTTLLAQVDASVGGKLGIDFGHLKNHIGLFREPVGTLIATDFLNTLPERELRNGFAEVIKHCIISDLHMWDRISSKSLDQQPWDELISHSVAFKYSVISKDPNENGLRKILNFGHTLGHAVETWFLAKSQPVFHGEAIAAGMIAEAFIAFRKDYLTEAELIKITSYVKEIFGQISLPDPAQIMPFLLQDKKNKGDKIMMALPQGIGKAVWDVVAGEEEIKTSMEYYNSL